MFFGEELLFWIKDLGFSKTKGFKFFEWLPYLKFLTIINVVHTPCKSSHIANILSQPSLKNVDDISIYIFSCWGIYSR
jgi:hypothetical protein